MPWKEMGRMELRRIFLERVSTGQKSMTEACREFGISRQCGYKWLRRFEAQGESGLGDRSRRPLRFRRPTEPEVERKLVEDRLRHPFWGARKLRKRLATSGAAPPLGTDGEPHPEPLWIDPTPGRGGGPAPAIRAGDAEPSLADGSQGHATGQVAFGQLSLRCP